MSRWPRTSGSGSAGRAAYPGPAADARGAARPAPPLPRRGAAVQDPQRRLERPGARRGGRGAGHPPGEPGLLRRDRSPNNVVEAGAAVPLTALISHSARAGLAGLEVLTGIPGTVGGALRGNAGDRQGSIGQFVRRATVIDAADEIQVRERDDLSFAERGSNLDEPVILSAEFELEPEDPEAVVRRMRRIWIIKKENQPYGHQSSGCIFKNPTPDLSAGTLIDQAGLKGTRHGGAEVSDRHANFIVAQPGATAADVLHLIDQIRQRVWQQFGYELELQIQVW